MNIHTFNWKHTSCMALTKFLCLQRLCICLPESQPAVEILIKLTSKSYGVIILADFSVLKVITQQVETRLEFVQQQSIQNWISRSKGPTLSAKVERARLHNEWTFSWRREGVHPVFWHLQIINLFHRVVTAVMKLVGVAELNYLVYYSTWTWQFRQFVENFSLKQNSCYHCWIQSNLPNDYGSILKTQLLFIPELFNVYVCITAVNNYCECWFIVK